HPRLFGLERMPGTRTVVGAPAVTAPDEIPAVPLDVSTFAKAASAIAVEIVLDDLLRKLVQIAIENAGAQRGLFLQEVGSRLVVEAEGSVDRDMVALTRSSPLDRRDDLCKSVLHYVRKTGVSVVLGDAARDDRFGGDPYVVARAPRSILCVPVIHRGRFGGILYLENNLTTDAFAADRVQVLQI